MANDRMWWERDDLCYRKGRLQLGGRRLEALVAESGTPAFVYRAGRVRDNLLRLRTALSSQGVQHDVFYAIKANRYAPLLRYLKSLGQCGIDACSPGELRYALEMGFSEGEISYTGTSVSETDLDCLQSHPAVHVNCDSISTIRRLGKRCPGRRIGIRVNPEIGAGYNDRMSYAGAKATKFGIYRDRFEEAVALARSTGQSVETLHFHVGCGYVGGAVEVLDQVLERVGVLLDAHPELRTVNIGGGLGLRLTEADVPVDLERWAAIIARHLGARGLRVHLEPGDYLVKDSGVLLVRVNTVEDKGGTRFVGVDAGLNILNHAAYYQTPNIVTPLVRAARPGLERVTVAGNINEGIDILADDVELPALAEGDLLAILNVGGYGSAMSSNHCMRGEFRECLLPDEA